MFTRIKAYFLHLLYEAGATTEKRYSVASQIFLAAQSSTQKPDFQLLLAIREYYSEGDKKATT